MWCPISWIFSCIFGWLRSSRNDGGAAFVVDENDCDDDASGSFLAAGSFRDRGSDHDSTGQAEYSLVGVKHCAKVEVHEVEGETLIEQSVHREQRGWS